MAKLILTSNGTTAEKEKREFLKMIGKDILKIKALALYTERKKEGQETIKSQLKGLGIVEKNIKLVNIDKKVSPEQFNNFDIIYVYGGNTYSILDRIRKTGLDNMIKEKINKGAVYLGNSAGSIIAGPSIEITEFWNDTDPNNVNLKDLTGLNLTNVSIFPHLNQKLGINLEDFKKEVDYPVETLKDGESLIIKGEEINKI